MTKIKICGLTRLSDIEAVNQSMPDYAGFVFAPGKRQVDEKQAELLKNKLDPRVLTVGVFVNELPERILGIASCGIIDIAQLHGDESEEEVLFLKEKGLSVIRAVRVQKTSDILLAQKTSADFPLMDTFCLTSYGGTGKSFDWTHLGHIKRPFFLAGGISCENVDEAKNTGAYCLDVSSGAETDGRKDPQKIEFLCRRVHLAKSSYGKGDNI